MTGFFAGKTDRKRSDLQAIGRAMNDSLRHRGPDGQDIWQDPDTPLLLAHRRLAIIDLTEAGRQPMVSSSGRYVIVYNGEIYNHPALREDLEQSGFPFRGRSDTETILAAIEKWGFNQTLQKISGMFALVLWDRASRTLHFARDRLGKKPLYIGWAGKGLVFASELKALHAHPDFSPRISAEALSLYMNYGFVPAPSCIFEGVWTVPAGHRLSLGTERLIAGENLSPLMEPYWHHLHILEESRAKISRRNDEDTLTEFENLLTACVKDRLVSDVPLGTFLSGGIDSSAVASLMQSLSNRPVKTYSIGFKEAGFDEAGFAKKIAGHLGTDHHELYVSAGEALDTIPSLPEIYDEPFADASAIPTYLVSKFARSGVTVALSGDGGDEMLGGYNRHTHGTSLWAGTRWIPSPLRKAIAGGLRSIDTERWDALFLLQPHMGSAVHKTASILALKRQEDVYKKLLGGGSGVLKTLSPSETFLDRAGWQPPKNLSFAEKMMYWDALFYLPNDILAKVDRASMAVSLEARAPLLDQRMYEFCWTLPLHFKIRGGRGKWLLRALLKKHVPETLFERPKQGFSVPIGEWLRGPLKEWTEDLLNRENDYFDAEKIRAIWHNHLAGRGHHAQQLWTILMFQAWHRHWMK
ncbi:MAG: asparagine synthase (glutamine-hydrolyzing) [Alphaproteobacteria bacterium]|nr:asparagine synthase (glutamine-hydrolyzing) [Alphaproteobacteria bacterium]